MRTIFAAAALLAASLGTPATAASIIGLQVEGGGTQQVYALNNGNFLGLWGFDNREAANPGAGAVTISSLEDIVAGFIPSGDNIIAAYNGTNPINPGASEFDPLVYGFTVADDARLFDSLWIEWTGGGLVYQQPSRGTTSMSDRQITRAGDPFATVVPVPAALPLLLAGLGALAFAARRRAA